MRSFSFAPVLSLLTASVLALGVASSASAATHEVGPGRTYSNIQAAIEAAENGDTVLVYPNTYVVYPDGAADRLNFGGKRITVTSTDPTNAAVVASTIIELAESGPYQTCMSIVLFEHGEGRSSVLRGFTIRKGRDPNYGAGVRIRDGCSPTIERCVFTNNQGGAGTAVWSGTGSPLIRYNTFDGNVGGGSALCVEGRAVIQSNTFRGNCAAVGGAIGCYADAQILSNTFTGNWCGIRGNAILCGGDKPALIQGNVFADNTSSNEGGALYVGGATKVLSNVFRHNHGRWGGAILVGGGRR